MESAVVSLEDFEREAEEFARGLKPREDGATLVTLAGELGAGKTAFVKAVARAFGVSELVTSPTFVLEKIYLLPAPASFSMLIHIDAYRLEKDAELNALKFDELMQDPENLIMLEWPEHVSQKLPKPAVAISIETLADGSRKISYE